jgi:hypothetical protein
VNEGNLKEFRMKFFKEDEHEIREKNILGFLIFTPKLVACATHMIYSPFFHSLLILKVEWNVNDFV